MLQNWTKVCEMLLGQYPEVDEEMASRKKKLLKKVFEQMDYDTALQMLDRRDRIEKVILLALRKHPNGYYNAFESISRNNRFIYVHAYQSYVWNKAVTERLKRFGRKVLVGDLAIRKDQAHLIENVCDDLPDGMDVDEDPEEGNEVPKERETKNLVVDITE